ncbi:MAG: class I adenylate-forming enzyme family protein [Betaproteobacteria bacterium]|jgi:acyl-CoA synthetase (AMP-forming)/AMP-acid ligase II
MAESDPRAFCDLAGMVAEHARQQPDSPAIVDRDRRIDYGTLNRLADRVAASLQRTGLEPRDSIAICAATCAEYVAVFIGALRAGIAVAPLAPSSTTAQLMDMVRDCRARLLFVDAATAHALDEARAALPQGVARIRLDAADGETALAPWLLAPLAVPEPVTIDRAWPFNVIYSSGTTGTPKGIVQSHGMRWELIRHAPLAAFGPRSVTMVATPLYSNTTLTALLPTLAYGGCLILMAKFDTLGYLRLAQVERATHTMLVPVQYQRLMACEEFDRFDLSSFQVKFCTSAPFRAELKADVLARWPGALVEFYGMSEGGGTCILDAHIFPNKLHTVGKPGAGHDIRLIDEDGREVPRMPDGASQGIGEIVGRSPSMMDGYHGRPEKTSEAEWYDAEGRRYIRTGDVGRFDEDGFLILVDRRKDMIISGGFNIYPSDLEAVMLQHPSVMEAAVVGAPSTEWGETPVAFVVARPGHEIEVEALRDWCNAQVGKTQRLSAIRLVPELPRSAIGKVLKRELRELWHNNDAEKLQ